MNKHSFNNLREARGLGETIAIYALAILLALGLIFGFYCLESWIAMLLWNAILPSLFTFIGPISFWQMFGLQGLFVLLIPNSILNAAKRMNKD